jgi:hypothetical protein
MQTRIALVVVAALLVTAGLAGAGVTSASSGGHGVEGTWQVTIHREAPPPGQPADIEALINYAADGTLTESSNSGILRRTVGYGEWERVGERLYASSHVSFTFNPATGAWTGTSRLDRKVLVAEDGLTFVGLARLFVYDVDGNLLVDGARTTEFGRALEIHVIDDLP